MKLPFFRLWPKSCGRKAPRFRPKLDWLEDRTVPTLIELSNNRVDENAAVGTLIGTLSTTGGGGTSYTYTKFALYDGAYFNVSSAGEVRVAASGNFETKNSLQFNVRSTDNLGGTYDQALIVHLNDVNEAPTQLRVSSAGILDSTWDGDGKAFTNLSPYSDYAQGIAIQTDGKIVTAGIGGTSFSDFAVARFKTDGSLDTTFGTNGSVTTHAGSGVFTASVALQADGKIVVAGTEGFNTPTVLRYNTNGALDTTFDGDGIASFSFGGSDEINDVKILPDGRIAFLVDARSAGDFTVVLLNTNGSLDNTFNGNGRFTFDFNSSVDSARAMAVQSDGKIVVTGFARVGSNTQAAVARLNTNGTLDTTFDSDGKATFQFENAVFSSYAKAIAFQSDGKIVIAGGASLSSSNGIGFLRLNANGSLDTTFDSDGKKTFSLDGFNLYNIDGGVGIQPDGKIVAVDTIHPTTDDGRGVVVRLNANGSVDSTFDSDGRLDVVLSVNDDLLSDLAVQSDGKIVAVGAYGENATFQSTAVVRIGDAPSTLPPGAATGRLVAGLGTVDVDVHDLYTYTLLDSAGGAFKIVGSQLQVDNGTLLDYGVATSYNVTVRSTDAAGFSVSATFTIAVNPSTYEFTVTPANYSPNNISLSSNSVPENNVTNAVVATLAATDPDAGSTFTYALVTGAGSTDNASFAIVGNQLKISTVADFESQGSYTIRVRVTDNGSPALTFEKALTIQVTDVNDPPTASALSNVSFAENNANPTLIGTFSATDQDVGSTFTYLYTTGAGDTDNGTFTIVGNELWLFSVADFETKSSYSIRIRTADSGSPTLSFVRTFTIQVTDVNEAPTALSLSSASLIENNTNPTVVGTLSANDPDAGTSFTYSLVAGAGSTDNGLFSLAGNQLSFNAIADFETKPSYSIRARVTDNGSPGLTFETTFTIVVADVNEAPTALSLSNATVPENNANPTVVGTLSANDPDAGTSFSYTLITGAGSTDNGLFSVNGDQLSLNAIADFEAKSSYAIRVRVSDQGSPALAFEQTFTIQVTNVNEAPTSLSLSNTTLAENNANPAVVGTFSATDPDAGTTFTFSLVAGAGSTDNGHFSIVGNQLSLNAVADFESQSSLAIRIRVTDNGSPAQSFEKSFTIQVTDVNEEPTLLTLSNATISENNANPTVVGTLTALDPDGETSLTYSLVAGIGGTDNGLFSIVGNQLSFHAIADFESQSSYSIRVRVTDNGSPTLANEKTFIIQVTDVNEAPTGLSLSNLNIAENNANPTLIGTLAATDFDAGSVLTYELIAGTGSTDNGLFSIVGNQLSLNAIANFESQSNYFIRVRVTDSGSPAQILEKTFTIQVVDINEAPTALTLSNSTLVENNASPTVVGVLSATDFDTGSTLAYTFVAGTGSTDNGLFSIVGDQLSFNSSADFEGRSSYEIRVRVTDDGSPALSIEKAFAIQVLDVNETPTTLTLSNAIVTENNPNPTAIGLLSASDVDLGSTLTYSFVDGAGSTDNGRFSIVGNQLSLNAIADHESQSSFSIRIRSTDNGSPALFTERVFVVQVQDVNEAPTALLLSNTLVAENNPATTVVGILSATDPDAGAALTYTLLTPFGGLFSIVGNQLSLNATTNFETQSSYTIRIRVTDNGAPRLSTEGTLAVLVTDVNEAPVTTSFSTTEISENNTPGVTVGRFETTDQDLGDSFTYTLVNGIGATDNSQFTISGNALRLQNVADFETKGGYSVRVRTEDHGGLAREDVFVINITNVNEQVTLLALEPASIQENQTPGTLVGRLSAADPDANTVFSYTMVPGIGGDDNASFEIRGSDLVFLASADFEKKSTYFVRIQVSDGNFVDQKPFVVSVVNVNEMPTITVPQTQSMFRNGTLTFKGATAFRIDDDSAGVVRVTLRASSGTLKATPAQGVTLTGNPSSSVTLVGTVAAINKAFASVTYQPGRGFRGTAKVTLTIFDFGVPSLSTTKSVSIQVLNRSPIAIVSSKQYNVPMKGTLSVPASKGLRTLFRDPDGDTLTFSLVSKPSKGTVKVAANGSFTYKPAIGFRGKVTFKVKANDRVASSRLLTITINVG